MNLQSVPTPYAREACEGMRPLVDKILNRTGEPYEEFVAHLERAERQAFVVMDGWERKALIITEVRKRLRGGKCLTLVACAGEQHRDWFSLLSLLEGRARDWGCSSVEAIARLGWKKKLEAAGYRSMHIILEKELR